MKHSILSPLGIALMLMSTTSMYAQPGSEINVGRWKGSSSEQPFSKPFEHTRQIVMDISSWNDRTNYLTDTNVEFDTVIHWPTDTSGCHLNGEYLWYRTPTLKTDKPLAVYVSDIVTNAMYREFESYVFDSTRRMVAASILWNYDKGVIKSIDDSSNSCVTGEWRLDYDLNIDRELATLSKEEQPANHLLFPPHERTEFLRAIPDPRRLVFKYYWSLDRSKISRLTSPKKPYYTLQGRDTSWSYLRRVKGPIWIRELINISRDSLLLFESEVPENYKVWLVSNYNTNDRYQQSPAVGMSGRQAEAFCLWKQKMINKYLKRKKVPLYAEVSLPYQCELPMAQEQVSKRIKFREIKPDWWRITHSDYSKFIHWVQDSIMRSRLIKEFSEFIADNQLTDNAYEQRDSRFVKLNTGIRLKMNRGTTYGDSLYNWFVEESGQIVNITHKFWEEGLLYPGFIVYSYSVIDYTKAAYEGGYALDYFKNYNGPDHYNYACKEADEFQNPTCKDLDISWENSLGINNGIRSHEDRSRFIQSHQVNIYPNDTLYLDSCKGCSVQGLNWEKAQAYYHWLTHKDKEHRKKYNASLEGSILPTKEQYERVMNNENVVLEEKECQLPGTVFRYVIRLYPK